MDITPIIPNNLKVIRGYGPGSFKVNDEIYQNSIAVFPTKVTSWNVTSSKDITNESLEIIIENNNDIELILIGCGEEHCQLAQLTPSTIINKYKVGVEIMTTGAACRTYNVLLAEGRKVAAALIAL